MKPTIALFVFAFLTACQTTTSHQRRKRTRRWLSGSPFSIPTSQCHPRKVRKTWHPARRRIRLEIRAWFRRHCYVIRRRRGRLEIDVTDFSSDFPAAAAFTKSLRKSTMKDVIANAGDARHHCSGSGGIFSGTQSQRPQDSSEAASVQTPDLVSPRTTTITSLPGREPLAIRQWPAASV